MMEVLTLIVGLILFTAFDYLFIYLEVRENPDLFYALHRNEIIRALNKLDKKLKD